MPVTLLNSLPLTAVAFLAGTCSTLLFAPIPSLRWVVAVARASHTFNLYAQAADSGRCCDRLCAAVLTYSSVFSTCVAHRSGSANDHCAWHYFQCSRI